MNLAWIPASSRNPKAFAAGGITLVIVVLGVLVSPLGEWVWGPRSYEACAARYGAVPNTFPAECKTRLGRIFADAPPHTPATFVLYNSFAAPVISPLRIEGAVPQGVGQVVARLYQGEELVASAELLGEMGETEYRNVAGTLVFTSTGQASGALVLYSDDFAKPIYIPLMFVP